MFIFSTATYKICLIFQYYNIFKDKIIDTIDETPEHHGKINIRHQIVAALYNIKPMFQKPLVVYLTMICFKNFLVMCM